jgi:hypothetical protein
MYSKLFKSSLIRSTNSTGDGVGREGICFRVGGPKADAIVNAITLINSNASSSPIVPLLIDNTIPNSTTSNTANNAYYDLVHNKTSNTFHMKQESSDDIENNIHDTMILMIYAYDDEDNMDEMNHNALQFFGSREDNKADHVMIHITRTLAEKNNSIKTNTDVVGTTTTTIQITSTQHDLETTVHNALKDSYMKRMMQLLS